MYNVSVQRLNVQLEQLTTVYTNLHSEHIKTINNIPCVQKASKSTGLGEELLSSTLRFHYLLFLLLCWLPCVILNTSSHLNILLFSFVIFFFPSWQLICQPGFSFTRQKKCSTM